MAKDMGPFRDLQALYWLSGPRTDVPAEPPSHRACLLHTLLLSYALCAPGN